jgi:DNA-binding PucR family transcriptional regulator
VTCFHDLGLLLLLTAASDPGALDHFVADRIGRLLEHDAERHSKLVETLTAYLDAGAALDAAAEALFIHRSTLKYRLGRIRELLDVDLSDPSARFDLQLACGIHAVVEALRSSDEGVG